jgi:hypothetical protein
MLLNLTAMISHMKMIKKGLFVGTVAALITARVCFGGEINPSGYKIPDLSEAQLADSVYYDLTDRIEGKETRIDSYYAKDSKGELVNIIKASINDRVFMYGFENLGDGSYHAILDRDGDGNFEYKCSSEEELWEMQNKGSLPPDWVV